MLAPKKPAATLHYLIGEPERTCRAYASGDREPRASILADLLRSTEGGRVLNFIMRGVEVPWWTAHCAAVTDAEILRDAVRRHQEQLSLPLPLPR